MRNPFRRKINGKNPKHQLKREDYLVEKQRIVLDGTSRRVETSLDDVLSQLRRISLFESNNDYVLPGAQTSVRASESETYLYLEIKTTKPLNYEDYPAHGHEEPLARLLRTYEFRPVPKKTYHNNPNLLKHKCIKL
jgi:hypothetical protein